jgi:hypothetical protein
MAGAVSLVVSGIAMAAQYAVTPVHVANGGAQEQVAGAGGHAERMQASIWLDLVQRQGAVVPLGGRPAHPLGPSELPRLGP